MWKDRHAGLIKIIKFRNNVRKHFKMEIMMYYSRKLTGCRFTASLCSQYQTGFRIWWGSPFRRFNGFALEFFAQLLHRSTANYFWLLCSRRCTDILRRFLQLEWEIVTNTTLYRPTKVHFRKLNSQKFLTLQKFLKNS